MDLHSVLVTGANRGIGLGFVRQLANLPKPPRFIFATYRSSESLGALTEIRNASKSCQVILIKMDVRNPEDVSAARKVVEQAVGEYGLTLLINNAAVQSKMPFPNVTEENLLKHFTTNTIGPIRVFQAAMNMAMRTFAANVKSQGILVIMMCPGWVKTNMGTDAAEITVEECTSDILQTLEKLDDSHHGVFMDRFGNPYEF